MPLNYKLHTRITLSMQMTNKYGEKGFPFWSPLVGLKLGSQMSFHTSKKKKEVTQHMISLMMMAGKPKSLSPSFRKCSCMWSNCFSRSIFYATFLFFFNLCIIWKISWRIIALSIFPLHDKKLLWKRTYEIIQETSKSMNQDICD